MSESATAPESESRHQFWEQDVDLAISEAIREHAPTIEIVVEHDADVEDWA